jgi:hypothetical protein
MSAFEIIHQDSVVGKLTCFDRLILKGHLTRFYPKGGMKGFLDSQGVLLKDFGVVPPVDRTLGPMLLLSTLAYFLRTPRV